MTQLSSAGALPNRLAHELVRWPKTLKIGATMLKGDIPSPYSIPPGCRFQTRCPKAQAMGRSVAPPSIQVSPTHVADCHFTT